MIRNTNTANSHQYRSVEEACESSRSTGEFSSTQSLDSAIPMERFPEPPNFMESRQQRRAVILFSITSMLLFADQNLMSPNLTAIAEDFGFNEEERDRKLGGDISLAFFLLGAPASFVIGYLADTADRSLIFAWTVLIGEGACFLTYWTTTYQSLYICRAITGFSVGGALPLIYSILGDLFAAEDRHRVSAIVSFGCGAGISVGQAIAGYIGPTFGWRLPFLLVSIPAVLLGFAVLWFVEDPPRGQMEQAVLKKNLEDGIALVSVPSESNVALREDSDEKATVSGRGGPTTTDMTPDTFLDDEIAQASRTWVYYFRTLQTLLSTPTMGKHYAVDGSTVLQSLELFVLNVVFLVSSVLALIQGATGCVPWGILNVYLTDYLSEDRGFSVEVATTVLMCFGVGNTLGLVLGGSYGSHLYKIDNRYPALLAGSMAVLGCIPFWLLINNVDSSTPFWLVVLIAGLAGFGTGPTGAIVKATVTNISLPRTRGQAFALFTLTDDFGKGLGPYFVSVLIVRMGGRLAAFNVGLMGWIVCGIFNLAMYFTVAKDEAWIQAEVAAGV
ncbi:unnamed protein product [Cylindrotheca closterium]|uniref:Major facilitator superfamily (MFS) profile domain-containing protein n=1 Tax=Cylindrotheca closterium TaxID=2856 RepID=A0AAD2CQ33_9STRA|nr:unnamed protein product [Cylindrotheca closterium]